MRVGFGLQVNNSTAATTQAHQDQICNMIMATTDYLDRRLRPNQVHELTYEELDRDPEAGDTKKKKKTIDEKHALGCLLSLVLHTKSTSQPTNHLARQPLVHTPTSNRPYSDTATLAYASEHATI
jgi:hypothetical protein